MNKYVCMYVLIMYVYMHASCYTFRRKINGLSNDAHICSNTEITVM